tara:strand:- start:545 stop:772 length:228 start_codon:yes stop_codon:yes gene_type:complete
MLKINFVTMKEEIEDILMNSYDNFGFFDEAKATKELLKLFDVSYSVFDHETIQRIRNSSSDAEVRRMIKSKIQKL